MSLNKVSSQILDAVKARLSDSATGFNAGILANAPNYGLPSNFISLNFSGSSMNFFLGQIDPQLMEETGYIQYPCAGLYILESMNTNAQKFNQFSGSIRCILDIYLSWVGQRGMQNFEAYPLCVEDVVVDVINRVQNQNWSPVVYNGMIQCKRGPLQFGAQNFRQKIGFSMIFELHQ